MQESFKTQDSSAPFRFSCCQVLLYIMNCNFYMKYTFPIRTLISEVVTSRKYPFCIGGVNILCISRFQRKSYSKMSHNSKLVAVCQLSSTSDKDKNFNICKSLIENAKTRGAKMVFLPECFDHVGESKKQSIELAESIDGPLITKYKEIAKTNSIWLSLGGFHEKGSNNESRIYNSHIVINNSGELVSVYRKIHLFDIDVPGKVRLKESDYTIPGSEIISPVTTEIGKVGLGTCYDLRFPEFSLSLTKGGAEILTYPSAFTQATGMAHWEPLLRSRAIESQCYVIAAAQTGEHNPKRTSYGHAMVVDPWGCIIACCSEGVGITFAEINLDYLIKVRSGMPVWLHRRPELYGDVLPAEDSEGIKDMEYMFGPIKLQLSSLFYKTKFSMAFVNKKPVVPGHVLVSPLRVVNHLSELSHVEVADIFNCVQRVQGVVQNVFNASSSTVSIQDGPDAGQSVPHLHVHILPRKPGDFKRNDDIYVELETHDKKETGEWRTEAEMADEAKILRKYFYK